VIDRLNLGMGICLSSLTLFVSLVVPLWATMMLQFNAMMSGGALLYIDHTLYVHGMNSGSIRTSVNIFLVIVFLSLVRYWAMTEAARRSVEHMQPAQEQRRLSDQLDRNMHAFKKMAETDPLTQLYSRGGFIIQAQKQLETYPEQALTLVFIDFSSQ
jgi:hypothetical protein